jgi:hypothetical protein
MTSQGGKFKFLDVDLRCLAHSRKMARRRSTPFSAQGVDRYVCLTFQSFFPGDDFHDTLELLESVLAEGPNLEEKGISYYENILQQEFGKFCYVYRHVRIIGTKYT